MHKLYEYIKNYRTQIINSFARTRRVIGRWLSKLLSETELYESFIDLYQNLIRISYNVLFESPGYTLKADVIEIDLITKNMNIFMNKKLTNNSNFH